MSREVDERVVSMQFDNKNFERNVSTTMSTLEKLKQKLNLSGASKGLENVGAAAKKVDMSGLSSGVETVRSRFSALEVIGVTALANITNSAVNAGKRMISALTIDPVTTGFSEYETKINSIQTIMSNTASKGTTMEDVTRVIGELNTYADKTIYNFAEMTRNIGTFTAAGVGLEESAAAIQGIANLAAASGSTSQQASTAMYQLSQALAAGTVKLMDWNSVVNAGMGGEKFQEALKATARDHGVAVDQMIKDSGSFRESLQKGWITADILNETLNKFTVDGAKKYAKSMQDSGKWTKEQADALVEEARNMEDAATKVKTFTQLCDTLKESAQSGWAQTWELIVGDFYEARDLLTKISDVVGGFINKMSEWRNFLLEGALDLASPWRRIVDKLEGSGLGNIVKAAEKLGEVTDKVKYFQDIVSKVWRGDYGNGKPRVPALEDDGYNYKVVQDLVNKGAGYKLTIEDIEASHKKFGITMEKSTESTKKAASAFNNLTDEQLRNAGLTEDEINLYRALEREAAKSGKTVGELADEMSKADGRTMLIESFTNMAKGLGTIFTSIKNAWVEIFNPPGAGELAVKLYGIISRFHEFSKGLTLVDAETGEFTDTAKKLQRTFEGIFAVVDLVTTILGGGLKIAFKVVSQILSYFNLDILDVTANIGDALVGFRDWVDSILDFEGVIDRIAPRLKEILDSIRDWGAGIKDADDIPKYIIEGLVNGIKNGVKLVGEAILEVGKAIVNKITEFLGIESPSTVFFAIGGFIISGLLLGLIAGIPGVKEWFGNLGKDISEWFSGFGANFSGLFQGMEFDTSFFDGIKEALSKFKDFLVNFDYSKLLSLIPIGAAVFVAKKAYDVATTLTDGLSGINSVLEGFADIEASFSKVLKSVAFDTRAKAIQKLVISLAILVAAVIALTYANQDNLWSAVGVVLVLSGVLIALSVAMSKMSDASVSMGKDGLNVKGMVTGLASIGLALLAMAAVVKIIGSMDPEQAKQGFIGLGVMMIELLAFMGVARLMSKTDGGKLSSGLIKLSLALMLMVGVVKLVNKLSGEEMMNGAVFAAAFVVFVGLLCKVTKKSSSEVSKVGSMVLKLSIAMGLLVGVVKLIGKLSDHEMLKGVAFAAGFVLFVKALLWATKVGKDKEFAKLGGLILSTSLSLLMLVGVCKLVGMLSADELIKGAAFALAFVGFVKLLVKATEVADGKQVAKAAGTIIAAAGAIAILATVSVLLGMVSLEMLAKGVAAVSILGLIMAAMIKATTGAQKCVGNLIVMTVAIAVMTAAVAILASIETEKMLAAVGALSYMIGAFALMIRSTKSIEKSNIGPLATMLGVIIVLGGVLWALQALNIQASMTTVGALSMLLIAMSASLVILSKMGNYKVGDLMSASLAMGALAVVVGMLGLVLAMMTALPVENAIVNATALSVMLGAMSGVMVVLSKLGTFKVGNLMSASLAMAALAGVMAILGLVLAMMTALGVQDAIPNAVALSVLLLAMSVVCTIISFIPSAAAIDGAIGFVAFIGILAALLAALGGLSKIPGFNELITDGGKTLSLIGYALGNFVGSIVGGLISGIAGGILTILPQLGAALSAFMVYITPFVVGVKMVNEDVLIGAGILSAAIIALMTADLFATIASFGTSGLTLIALGGSLSKFMEAVQPFIEGAANIKPEMMAGVKVLAETILLLTAADFLNSLLGWTSIFTGKSSLENFGDQLGSLGKGLQNFCNEIKSFSTAQLDRIRSAAEAVKILAEVADLIPNSGGLLGDIVGNNDLGTFADQFPNLAIGLRRFAVNLETFDSEQLTKVSNAAEAIKILADASQSIPNSGGWLGAIVGDNDLGVFADQFPNLGIGLRSFVDNIGTFDDSSLTTVDCASKAIKSLADSAQTIPNTGGLWAAIVGDNSLAAFGEYLPSLGANLNEFVTNLGTFEDPQVVTIECAGKAIAALASAASNIDGQADWAKSIFGDNSLAAFGDQLGSLGTNIKAFADNLGTFEQPQLNAVRQGINAVEAFAALAGTDLGGAKNNLSGFSEKLPGFAENIATFCTTIPSAESISGATAGVDTMVTIIDKLDSLESFGGGAQHFVDALNTLADSAVDEFVEAFTGESSKTATFDAGASLLKEAIKGMESTLSDINTAIDGLVSSAISGIKKRLNYDKFWLAGNYLVEGFALGIDENTFKAEAEAKAMAKAAAQAAQDELDINSPSKVFKAIGGSIPEGFAMGIDNLSGLVKSSSVGMANTALDNVKNSISRIADAVSGDIDYQPTIRPVLDLSDVRSGVDTMGSMLNFGSSVGVMGNIGAINSMMKSRGQNGANADVVSAIGKLGKSLGNVGNTSYNINGVNYSADSEVADAIKVIARAMKIEGRT